MNRILKEAKRSDTYYSLAKQEWTKLTREYRVSVFGWIKQTKIDNLGTNDRGFVALNFTNPCVYYCHPHQDKKKFKPYTRTASLDDSNSSVNFPILRRVARLNKYKDFVQSIPTYEQMEEKLSHLFYCIRIISDGYCYVYDFVQKKLTKYDNGEIYDNRSWFYYPQRYGDKVLEWWKNGFDNVYCKTCWSCGERVCFAWEEENSFKMINGHWYCNDCLSEKNYGVCDLTHKLGFRTHLKFSCDKDKKEVQEALGVYKDEMDIIPEEIPDNVKSCYKCYCWFVVKDRDGLCEECKYTKINTYSTKIEKFLRAKTDAPGEKCFFGTEVEIEVDKDESVDECAKKLNRELNQMVFLKSDSSIHNGFEIVSFAMTYKRWYGALCKFKKIYQDVINLGGYSEQASTTGLHIHISREGFKDKNHLARFARCFYLDKDMTEYFACRPFNHYAMWGADGETDRLEEPDYFENRLRYDDIFDSKYHIVNFRHQKTVEIRMFNGTLRIDVIFAHIQFCKLLMDYTRDKNSSNDLNAEDMFTYLKTNAHSKILKGLIKLYEIKKQFSLREVKTA